MHRCVFLQHLDTPLSILGLDSPKTKDMVTKSTGLVWVHSSRGLFAAKNLKMPRFYAQRRNGSNTKRDVTNWMWRTMGEKVCEGFISLFGVSIWRWICNVRDRWNIGVSSLKKILSPILVAMSPPHFLPPWTTWMDLNSQVLVASAVEELKERKELSKHNTSGVLETPWVYETLDVIGSIQAFKGDRQPLNWMC